MEPCEAVKGAGTTYDSFITDIREKSTVPDDIYYKETIGLLILYNFLKARPENKTYRNAKAPVIAYAIAYLHYITFDSFDLLKIWQQQDLSDNQKKGLNKLCEIIFRVLDSMATSEGTSVLSYSKRKDVFHNLCDKITSEEFAEVRNLVND